MVYLESTDPEVSLSGRIEKCQGQGIGLKIEWLTAKVDEQQATCEKTDLLLAGAA